MLKEVHDRFTYLYLRMVILMVDDLAAITATFSWGSPEYPNPHLVFSFNPHIHPDNIKEIAKVMAQTAANKMDCMNLCSLEGDYNGQTGSA